MQVSLPRTMWWDEEDAAAGRSRRVFLAWPDQPVPATGYPALFILDANAGFATAVEAYRARAWRTTIGAACPALLVGIGHTGDGPYDSAARTQDYTPPADAGAPGEFLAFIEDQLLPALERRHPLDRSELGLVGHSLGGLFTLHTLLARPGLFRRLVVASPSLWWNDGAMLQRAERFAAVPPPAARDARVLVTAGSLEESDAGPRGALRAGRRMIGNARRLTTVLQESGLTTSFALFPDEDHGSARIPAVVRATRFGLP